MLSRPNRNLERSCASIASLELGRQEGSALRALSSAWTIPPAAGPGAGRRARPPARSGAAENVMLRSMTRADAAQRITDLREQIHHHDYRYYLEARPEVHGHQ